MTNIVERLRDMADQRHMDRGNDAVDDALREAADEIERMRSERLYIIGFIDGWESAHEAQPGDGLPFPTTARTALRYAVVEGREG